MVWLPRGKGREGEGLGAWGKPMQNVPFGMDWEFGVNRCKLLLLEWISNEILLYSTRNYIYPLMMEHDNVRKKNVYMYV